MDHYLYHYFNDEMYKSLPCSHGGTHVFTKMKSCIIIRDFFIFKVMKLNIFAKKLETGI